MHSGPAVLRTTTALMHVKIRLAPPPPQGTNASVWPLALVNAGSGYPATVPLMSRGENTIHPVFGVV